MTDGQEKDLPARCPLSLTHDEAEALYVAVTVFDLVLEYPPALEAMLEANLKHTEVPGGEQVEAAFKSSLLARREQLIPELQRVRTRLGVLLDELGN